MHALAQAVHELMRAPVVHPCVVCVVVAVGSGVGYVRTEECAMHMHMLTCTCNAHTAVCTRTCAGGHACEECDIRLATNGNEGTVVYTLAQACPTNEYLCTGQV